MSRSPDETPTSAGGPRGRPPRSAVRAAVRRCLADLEPGRRVIVALSGGADSLALLAAVLRVAPGLGLLVEVVVVDHGVQPGSSAAAARAAEQAVLLGCSAVRVVAVEVARGPDAGGPEAAARVARYAALARAADHPPAEGVQGPEAAADRLTGDAAATLSGGAAAAVPGVAAPGAAAPGNATVPAVVLLGHTRDDQAETVLLGLARGSGTRSLSGMAPTSGIYRRPLLGLPRELVARAAAEAADRDPRLRPWVDPQNRDPSFARVRVRADLLACLEEALGPGVVAALARSADLARDDADALDEWARAVWAGPAGAQEVPAGVAQEVPAGAQEVPARAQEVPAGVAQEVPAGVWRLDVAALTGGSAPLDPRVPGDSAAPQDGPVPVDGPVPPDGPVKPDGSVKLDGSVKIDGSVPLSAPGPRGRAVRADPEGGSPGRSPDPVAAVARVPGRPDRLPRAVTTRVVRRFLVGAGCPAGSLTAEHVRAVHGLLERGGPQVALPGGRVARREGGAIVVRA